MFIYIHIDLHIWHNSLWFYQIPQLHFKGSNWSHKFLRYSTAFFDLTLIWTVLELLFCFILQLLTDVAFLFCLEAPSGSWDGEGKYWLFLQSPPTPGGNIWLLNWPGSLLLQTTLLIPPGANCYNYNTCYNNNNKKIKHHTEVLIRKSN